MSLVRHVARVQFSDANVNFPLHLRHFTTLFTFTLCGNLLKIQTCLLKRTPGYHFVHKILTKPKSTRKGFYLFKFSKMLKDLSWTKRMTSSMWQVSSPHQAKPASYLVKWLIYGINQTLHITFGISQQFHQHYNP
jgi:hypothetical protein